MYSIEYVTSTCFALSYYYLINSANIDGLVGKGKLAYERQSLAKDELAEMFRIADGFGGIAVFAFFILVAHEFGLKYYFTIIYSLNLLSRMALLANERQEKSRHTSSLQELLWKSCIRIVICDPLYLPTDKRGVDIRT